MMIPLTLRNGETTARLPRELLALLSALRLIGPDTKALTFLSQDEWQRLLSFCDVAQLTLPLAKLPLEGAPNWVLDRLRTNLRDNALRFEKIKETYREAAAAFEHAGVEHIVIKGFSQSPDFVSHPESRYQSDIDVLCRPEAISAARDALHAIGYASDKSANITNADHDHGLVRPGVWQWRGNRFDPEMPVGIELHFCLWNEQVSRISIPETDGFWHRRIHREVDGLSFPCLNPVDHVGHLALHILRNIFLRDWILHHVRELAVFLHQHADDDSFWQIWVDTHSPSLRSLEVISFYLARSWFGCNLHSKVEEEIATLSPERLDWLQYFSLSPLDVAFRMNKDALWLQLGLIATRRERLRVLCRTLLPAHIAPPSSPTVRVRNKRPVRSAGIPRWLLYVRYLAARSVTHSWASITTLSRGLQWSLWRNRLAPQFWIFLAASFFFDLGLSIFYFLFNLFLVGHGYTERNLGLITGAMAAGNLVGALPAGRLAQSLGLRPVLLSCFLLAVAISATRALLLPVSSQLILAFLAGITLSAWAVCLSPAVAQLTTAKQRPIAFSLLFSLGIGLGAVGGLAGSRFPCWFASNHLFTTRALEPSQLVLLLSCGIVALGIWPAARLRFDTPQPEESSHNRPLLSPFLLRFLPAIAVWSFVTGSFSPLASVYMARHIHLSLQQIGNAFSLSQIVQVVAVLAAPLLFRRIGLVAGIVSTQIAASFLLLALSILSHPVAAIVAYISFAAFQWMNEPGLYSLLMNSVPSTQRDGASASNSLASSASQVIAATLAGAAFARYGYPSVLRAIALFALVSATLFWNLQDRRQHKAYPAIDDVTG